MVYRYLNKITLVLFVSIGAIILIKSMEPKTITKLNYDLLWAKPFSLDPMLYDNFVHHKCFTSVFSRLVTLYSEAGIKGELASSWSVSEDFKVWKFSLRKDITFENGDLITSKHVYDSFRRVAFLMKQKDSKSGLFENIIGFNQFKNIKDSFAGLKAVSDHEFWIELKESDKNLLETISFGLYGIVHSSNYDLSDGKWKNPKEGLSSSIYRVKSWDDQKLILERREKLSTKWGHPNKFEEIIFRLDGSDEIVDLKEGVEESEYSDDMYYAGNITSSIVFARLSGYKNKENIFSVMNNRHLVRSLLIKEYANIGQNVLRSFFPLSMKNIVELSESSQAFKDEIVGGYKEIKILLPTPESRILEKSETIQTFLSVIRKIADNLNIHVKEVYHDNSKSGVLFYGDHFDIVAHGTGILVENPDADIRFMVKSKEGIQLPDPTGVIEKELDSSSEKVDAQKINSLLWEDALVWGLKHRSQGLWFRKSLVDLNFLNKSLPSTDFNWIGIAK